ncbi:hypothetical protein NTR1_53 [Nocardia phage NTR1]|nr:hypothetical protein NTR1_53 [Nocardia phage NTR1]
MSLKVCTAEFMISDSIGTGFSQAWLPFMAAERMATSGKDGNVDRAPDQVPFIDSEILWTNSYDDPVHAMMSIQRAPRSLVTSSPNTLVLDDAWTSDIGLSPSAPTPFGTNSGVGIRFQTRQSFNPLIYTRFFRDFPDWTSYVELGAIDPGNTLHFRYRCLYSTPGGWRTPVQPLMLAQARYARLRLWIAPWTTGVI